MDEPRHPVGRLWELYKMGGITPAVASMFHSSNAQHIAFIRSLIREQRKDAALHTPLAELETVVFDLETTGFSPDGGDEIISVGAVAMKGEARLDEPHFYSLVNPGRPIPSHIVQLTGITDDMAGTAPDLIATLRRFLHFVQKRTLIAHGCGHDRRFLDAALWRTSRIRLSHRMLDTMMIAKWLFPRDPAYDLDSLLQRYGIRITRRHEALQDALMTAELWSRMIRDILSRQVRTLGELYAYLSAR